VWSFGGVPGANSAVKLSWAGKGLGGGCKTKNIGEVKISLKKIRAANSQGLRKARWSGARRV